MKTTKTLLMATLIMIIGCDFGTAGGKDFDVRQQNLKAVGELQSVDKSTDETMDSCIGSAVNLCDGTNGSGCTCAVAINYCFGGLGGDYDSLGDALVGECSGAY